MTGPAQPGTSGACPSRASTPPPRPSPADGPLLRRYYEAGVGSGQAIVANRQSWARLTITPHVAVDVTYVEASIELLGRTRPTPWVVAPTAYLGCLWEDGESVLVETAADIGALPVISARSATPVERYARRVPWWQQIYVYREFEHTRDLAVRASAGGAEALVLTVDTPALPAGRGVGKAELSLPHPVLHANHPGVSDPQDLEQSPSVTERDIEQLARCSGLPVVVKGVLRGDDAKRCLDAGAAAIWVSNHGGRQIDRAASPASVLAEVRSAVGTDADVLVDGGIRCGADAFSALCLGANAVAVGRLPGLALLDGGRKGLADALQGLHAELIETMTLAGTPSRASMTADLLGPEPTA